MGVSKTKRQAQRARQSEIRRNRKPDPPKDHELNYLLRKECQALHEEILDRPWIERKPNRKLRDTRPPLTSTSKLFNQLTKSKQLSKIKAMGSEERQAYLEKLRNLYGRKELTEGKDGGSIERKDVEGDEGLDEGEERTDGEGESGGEEDVTDFEGCDEGNEAVAGEGTSDDRETEAGVPSPLPISSRQD